MFEALVAIALIVVFASGHLYNYRIFGKHWYLYLEGEKCRILYSTECGYWSVLAATCLAVITPAIAGWAFIMLAALIICTAQLVVFWYGYQTYRLYHGV